MYEFILNGRSNVSRSKKRWRD